MPHLNQTPTMALSSVSVIQRIIRIYAHVSVATYLRAAKGLSQSSLLQLLVASYLRHKSESPAISRHLLMLGKS